jgi:hypothetical protein
MQLFSVIGKIGDKQQPIDSKLNTDPFPISMVEIEHRKILVRTDQAEMTKGRNVVIFDDIRNRMDDQAPQPGDWRVEGECAEEAGEGGKTHVGYAD